MTQCSRFGSGGSGVAIRVFTIYTLRPLEGLFAPRFGFLGNQPLVVFAADPMHSAVEPVVKQADKAAPVPAMTDHERVVTNQCDRLGSGPDLYGLALFHQCIEASASLFTGQA